MRMEAGILVGVGRLLTSKQRIMVICIKRVAVKMERGTQI